VGFFYFGKKFDLNRRRTRPGRPLPLGAKVNTKDFDAAGGIPSAAFLITRSKTERRSRPPKGRLSHQIWKSAVFALKIVKISGFLHNFMIY